MTESGIRLPFLRQWRLQAVLTQAELAQRSGIHRATVARAELGEPISIANARKLADALGISPQTLVNKQPKK